MPTLHLHLPPLQTPAQNTQLAQALTDITARVLGKRPEVTAVLIHTLPQAQWFIGGAVPTQPTALLEIDITQGTNSVEEKAAFVDAVWHMLKQHLAAGGPLAPASYVMVRELPPTDWGYGGHTQRARQLARQLVPAPAVAS